MAISYIDERGRVNKTTNPLSWVQSKGYQIVPSGTSGSQQNTALQGLQSVSPPTLSAGIQSSTAPTRPMTLPTNYSGYTTPTAGGTGAGPQRPGLGATLGASGSYKPPFERGSESYGAQLGLSAAEARQQQELARLQAELAAKQSAQEYQQSLGKGQQQFGFQTRLGQQENDLRLAYFRAQTEAEKNMIAQRAAIEAGITAQQAKNQLEAMKTQAGLTRGTELALMNRQAELKSQAADKTLAALQGLSGSFPTVGLGGGFGGAGGIGGDGGFGAADAALFGRAKERTGQSLQGALKALSEAMQERGIAGSGIEGAGVTNLVGQGLGALSEFEREQVIQELDARRRAAELNLTAGVTQRGQDISRQNALIQALMSGNLY